MRLSEQQKERGRERGALFARRFESCCAHKLSDDTHLAIDTINTSNPSTSIAANKICRCDSRVSTLLSSTNFGNCKDKFVQSVKLLVSQQLERYKGSFLQNTD